jgi:hypothetical protein
VGSAHATWCSAGTRPDSFRVLVGGAHGTIKNRCNQTSQRAHLWLPTAFPRFR